MMTISAVLPTHRRPVLLAEALRSVLDQTRLPDEIVVVDDADDPATRACVDDFAAGAGVPVRYALNTACPGACGSRNLGAFLAAGDWIAFLDDDDRWHPAFLECLSACASADVPLLLSGLLRFEHGRRPVARSTEEGLTPANVLHHRSSMTGSNFLVSAELFCAVRGFDPAFTVFNDWDLFVRLVRHGARYAVVPEPLVEWRDHDGPRIATPSPRRAEGIEAFLRRYASELPPAMRRELRTTALGIRRRHAGQRWRYAALSLALAAAHGPLATLGRLGTRMSGPRALAG